MEGAARAARSLRLRAIMVGRLGARGGVRGANGVDRVPPCVAVYGDG